MDNNFVAYFTDFVWVLVLAVVWSAVWKALALWKSARNNNLGWFVVFCMVNTLGILEILYIYVFSKKCNNNNQPVNIENK